MPFDLQAALAALDTPAAWAVLGPATPPVVRAAWLRLFGADCAPLACTCVHEVAGLAGRPAIAVNVDLDALGPERVDRLLAIVTAGIDPTTAATMEFALRRAGLVPVEATGAVVAPTLAEARALAAAPEPEADRP